MAAGFGLRVNGIEIRTSEALYQACRFPHLPEVQKQIISAHSPMTAKMLGRPFHMESRQDWDTVKVDVMWWCLRVKLAQNWRRFGGLLLETGNGPIIEYSRKDTFWGARIDARGTPYGNNLLGYLLVLLRERLRIEDSCDYLKSVEPLSIPDFLLLQEPIGLVDGDERSDRPTDQGFSDKPPTQAMPWGDPQQPSLFDQ